MRYVAGAGVVNCDILYSGITRLPSEGEEIFSTGFDLQLGGGIPGIMVNLARLGVPVKFSTYLGNDFFSQFVKNQLEQFGVHYVNLYTGTGMPVNVTSVVITPKDRTFISHRDDFGYNDTMKQQLFEQLRGASIIRMSNHLYEVYSRIKQENPDTIFVMDTGWDDTMSLDNYAKYLELADYYTPNKKEALKLTQTDNVEDAARLLSHYFETTIIKLGPDGCLLRENGQNEIFPATSGIDPIDATGAGDAFNAGFIYGLYHNYDIRTCIAMGNRMGGACVSKVGCLSGYLTEEQLLREFQASNPSR